MARKVQIGPIRLEPETVDILTEIANETGVSVYELTRQAVADYVARHRAMVVFTDRLMAVANGETLNQV